jgi:sucrose-6-phosphate hydrolase SacC (GH32 family)
LILAAPLLAEDSPGALYEESLRPRFHITGRQWETPRLNPARGEEGWLNDPNGLVYYDGEYHLFAQRWARAWLHWVSRDLVHWEEISPAFTEAYRWDGVQSGSVVIDGENDSGLGRGDGVAPMLAFYSSGPRAQPDGTRHATQCLAFSNDRGRTWTKYEKNPVLADAERDPKVFRYEPEKKWIMVLYAPPGGYAWYSSRNLLDWEKMSFLPGFYECPDMFELPVDGDPGRKKWVVVNGDGSCFVGSFDGTKFTAESGKQRACFGPDFYATQTFGGMDDGRRVQMAWLRRGWYPEEFLYHPEMPFSQQMTFPCELSLRTHHGTIQVFRTPIREVAQLHRSERTWEAREMAAGQEVVLEEGRAFHLKMELEMAAQAEGEIRFRGQTLRFANGKIGVRDKTFTFFGPDRKPQPLTALELLLDTTSMEAFANEGEATVAAAFVPEGDTLALACTRGRLTIRKLILWEMGSIWKRASAPAPVE